jgi:HK97 family phage prohead protease
MNCSAKENTEEFAMLLRTKSGTAKIETAQGLLRFLRFELGLHPGEGGVIGGLDVEAVARAPLQRIGEGEECFSVGWTFSTFDLDSFEERIDPAGWDVERYLKNPVVQWAHRYDIPAIGRAEIVAADKDGLRGVVIFNEKEYDPFGWAIGERVRRGILRAGSVGFKILEIEIPDKETGKDGTSLIFRKQELLEFSICNVPANPAALVQNGKSAQASINPFWGNIIQG